MAQLGITQQDFKDFNNPDQNVSAFKALLARVDATNVREILETKVGGLSLFGLVVGGELPIEYFFGKVLGDLVAAMQGNDLETNQYSVKKIEEGLMLLHKLHQCSIANERLSGIVDNVASAKMESHGELVHSAAGILKQMINGDYKPTDDVDKKQLDKFTLDIAGYTVGRNPQSNTKIFVPKEDSHVQYTLWHEPNGMVHAEAHTIPVAGDVEMI